MLRLFSTLLFLCTALTAAEPGKPAVERIGHTRYRIGRIDFDSKSREIRFPAVVNMTEGLLEFLIVHQNGKIHESLLHTDVSPAHLNVAFSLLRYKPSPGETIAKASRLHIRLQWQDDGQSRTVPANEWIQHVVNGAAMPPGPWTYHGSFIRNGRFLPEATGDIAAIYLTENSLITYPGESNDDDTVWFPYPKRVPPVDTPVIVIISPYPEDSP